MPLVLYHGRDIWQVPSSLSGLLGHIAPALQPYVPDFQYHLIDLSRYAEEEIKGHVLIRVGLLLFKYVFRPDYREKIPAILRLLRELVEKKTGMQYIETVLRYIFNTVEGMDVDELNPIVEQNLSTDKGELVMTLDAKGHPAGLVGGYSRADGGRVR